jgi:hypothetical protein
LSCGEESLFASGVEDVPVLVEGDSDGAALAQVFAQFADADRGHGFFQ